MVSAGPRGLIDLSSKYRAAENQGQLNSLRTIGKLPTHPIYLRTANWCPSRSRRTKVVPSGAFSTVTSPFPLG